MSNDVSQGRSNSEVPEVTSRYVSTLDDLAVHIKLVRESAPPLFSPTVSSIFVEDWTRVMSLSLKFFSVPKSLKVKVACLFLRGAPAAWFERVAEPRITDGISLGPLWRGTLGASVLTGRVGWLKSLGTAPRILVRVALVAVRVQAPRVLQVEILEIVVVTVAILRRILRTPMGRRPGVGCSPCGLDSWDC